MTPLMTASLHTGEPRGGGARTQARAPAPSAPLGESFRFLEWADEYTILGLYRRIIVKGDDASKSLQLIKDAIQAYNYQQVEEAVRAYASEASSSEPRYRKRPFTFFQPDIVSQYIPSDKERQPSPVEELKASIEAAKLAKENDINEPSI